MSFDQSQPEDGEIRVGIVGAGIGQAHIAGFRQRQGVKVVALCARTPTRLRAVANRYGVARTYTDYEQMLGRENLDVVVVAPPDYLHHPVTIAALESGAHVLCEKPLALDVAEARDMADRADELGRRNLVSFTWRFFPAAAYMKEILNAGFVGQPYLVDVRYFTRGHGNPHGPMRWQFDGRQVSSGVLGNLGSHVIHLVHWWLGEIVRVTALLTTAVPEREWPDGNRARVEVDDTASFLGEFEDGTPLVFSSSWVTYVRQNFVEISVHGSDGMLVFQADAGSPDAQIGRILATRKGEPAAAAVVIPPRLIGEFHDAPAFDTRLRGSYGRMAAELVNAIREDRSASPSFRDGVAVQEVLDAVLASASSGRWTTVGAYEPPAS